jgi:hypothetical protein
VLVPGVIAMRCRIETKELLIEAAPDRFFDDDHYRGYPAVLVRLAEIESGGAGGAVARGLAAGGAEGGGAEVRGVRGGGMRLWRSSAEARRGFN